MRLSLLDRHLFPTRRFTSDCSRLIVDFQRHLAHTMRSNEFHGPWSFISDMFDGRLFAVTLASLNDRVRFDAETMRIVTKATAYLTIQPPMFSWTQLTEQFIEQPSGIKSDATQEKPTLVRINNRFVETYLKPVDVSAFQFVTPSHEQRFASYEGRTSVLYRRSTEFFCSLGRHHWHVYREVRIT
jgi:hypothetical protein